MYQDKQLDRNQMQDLAALAREYRQSADALENRLRELRRLAQYARGAESVSLEQRIQVMRYEMTDLRKIAVWLERYGKDSV